MNGSGRFSLSVRVEGNEALVTVLDDGSGITGELLSRAVEMALSRRAERAFTALNRPQLVLLDIGMPGVDGYRVVERLRSDLRLAQVPFVAVTGSGGEEARRRSREAGFAEHLVKPVSLETLRKLLERV